MIVSLGKHANPIDWCPRRPHLVSYHQDDDENQHGGHDDPSDDDDHGPAKDLRLHEVAPHVLRLGVELHAAHHACGRQRGDDIIIDGQHAEVVLAPRRQVVDQEVLARRGDHSVATETKQTEIFSICCRRSDEE